MFLEAMAEELRTDGYVAYAFGTLIVRWGPSIKDGDIARSREAHQSWRRAAALAARLL
jgi:hypothetical protein